MEFLRKLFCKPVFSIYAPMTGKAMPITDVPDRAFSEGMLGNGIAIDPADGNVYAPCDATVDMVFTTGHAISLVADCGAEILIHVGLESAGLDRQCFTAHVKNGDNVKKGQLLLQVDLAAMKAAGFHTITPVIICNADDYAIFKTHTSPHVTGEDIIIELSK